VVAGEDGAELICGQVFGLVSVELADGSVEVED